VTRLYKKKKAISDRENGGSFEPTEHSRKESNRGGKYVPNISETKDLERSVSSVIHYIQRKGYTPKRKRKKTSHFKLQRRREDVIVGKRGGRKII